jgi:hypothetical protein
MLQGMRAMALRASSSMHHAFIGAARWIACKHVASECMKLACKLKSMFLLFNNVKENF